MLFLWHFDYDPNISMAKSVNMDLFMTANFHADLTVSKFLIIINRTTYIQDVHIKKNAFDIRMGRKCGSEIINSQLIKQFCR